MPKTNDKKQKTNRSWIGDFIEKLREKWIETLIVTIVAFSFLLLGKFGGGIWEYLQAVRLESRTISRTEALTVAKEMVGAETIKAVPFVNKNSSQQYIAVLGKSPNRSSAEVLYILEGNNNIYQIYSMDLEAFDAFYHSRKDSGISEIASENDYYDSIFGVTDIESDGNKEIFLIYRNGGSGGYQFKISVVNSLEREVYFLRGGGQYADFRPSVEISDNTPQSQEMRTWLSDKAQELSLYGLLGDTGDERQAHDEAIQTWIRQNGSGFYDGQLAITKFSGEVPESGASKTCIVEDEEYQWIAFFKGAIFGHNKSNNQYFVVYVPRDVYE